MAIRNNSKMMIECRKDRPVHLERCGSSDQRASRSLEHASYWSSGNDCESRVASHQCKGFLDVCASKIDAEIIHFSGGHS